MRPLLFLRRCIGPSVLAGLATLVLAPLVSPAPALAQEAGRSIIPVDAQWPGARPFAVDISGDGQYVVFQANRGDGWKLFLHEVGQPTSRELVGLGNMPYFAHISPSGQWLFFGRKMSMWKTPLEGGPLTRLSNRNDWNEWETDETTLATRFAGGIWRMKADGSGEAEQVAAVDTASGAVSYARPSVLPGGKGVLVSVYLGTGADSAKIGLVSLPSGKLTLIDERGMNPRWSESGHILYTQGSTLKALPYDLDRLEVLGPSATVVQGVNVLSNWASEFAISPNGTLVYVPGRSNLGLVQPSALVWVDRTGKETAFDTRAEKSFGAVRLSPDRRFVAAEVTGSGLFLFDRQSGTWSRQSESANVGTPVWSADSKVVYYTNNGAVGRQSVEPGASWEELWRGDRVFWGLSLHGDGTRVLGQSGSGPPERVWRLVDLDLAGSPKVEPLPASSDLQRYSGLVSPDGKWLAYVGRQNGLDQVYVEPFPEGGTPFMVSRGSSGEAAEPMWGASSNELFYRDGVNMVSAELETSPALRIKRTTPLFPIRPYFSYLNTFAATYDYDPSTQRFLMLRNAIPDPPGTDIVVIENAFDLLNRLAPRK